MFRPNRSDLAGCNVSPMHTDKDSYEDGNSSTLL